jgi:hypothetical protein
LRLFDGEQLASISPAETKPDNAMNCRVALTRFEVEGPAARVSRNANIRPRALIGGRLAPVGC